MYMKKTWSKCRAILIYFDQLLTIRERARQRWDYFTLCLPVAKLQGLPKIENVANRERETNGLKMYKWRRQGRRRSRKAFLILPSALMRSFWYSVNARSCVIIHVHVHTKHPRHPGYILKEKPEPLTLQSGDILALLCKLI